MPDGFDPHTELARIWTLRDMMQSCRELAPRYREILEELLNHEDPWVQLAAVKLGMDRGFGRARQHHLVSDVTNANQSKVVILPDNGRSVNNPGKVIDAEA